jgi:hypothetical protein
MAEVVQRSPKGAGEGAFTLLIGVFRGTPRGDTPIVLGTASGLPSSHKDHY